MDAKEVARVFKDMAHDEITKDFSAMKVGLTELYRNAEKYGNVDQSDFDAAMARYFARVGRNVAESSAAFKAYREQSNEIASLRESVQDAKNDYL